VKQKAEAAPEPDAAEPAADEAAEGDA
jgi:hypothetical protein